MRFLRAALLAAAAFSGAACYTMRPVTFDQLSTARPGAVWITRSDQSVVVLQTPRVFGDTLVGYIKGEFQELPNTDMTQFRVKRMAGAKTAALVTGSVFSVATFAFLVSSSGKYVDPATLLDCEDDPDQKGCPGAIP